MACHSAAKPGQASYIKEELERVGPEQTGKLDTLMYTPWLLGKREGERAGTRVISSGLQVLPCCTSLEQDCFSSSFLRAIMHSPSSPKYSYVGSRSGHYTRRIFLFIFDYSVSRDINFTVAYLATPEYRTIVECTSSLILAIKNHLSDLSAQLLERHLITAAQESQMRDKMHSPESRAATLVELIRDRVEQNSKCYQIFIEALEADQLANGDILELLKGKYESLCKGEHIIIGFLQALWYN